MESKGVFHSLVGIDILRAVAALGVFFYHSHIGMLAAKYTHIDALLFIDTFGALYAVPLFFLISGYCIHLSNIKSVNLAKRLPLKKFFLRRLLRLYPAYLQAIAISILINFTAHPTSLPSIEDLLYHLFLLQGFSQHYFNTINLVLWTISIEAALYILYPVFYYIKLNFSLNRALLFSFLVSATSIVIISTFTGNSLPLRYCVFNIWFAWCCGAWMADNYMFNRVVFKNKLINISYVFIIAFALFAGLSKSVPQVITDQINIISWCGPLLWILRMEPILSQSKNIILRLIVNIGLSSYSLYLLHQPLLYLKNYLVHTYFQVSLQPFLVALGVVVILPVAYINFLYFEKPFMKQAKKYN